jgi:Uma2 family endonuclease
MRTGRTPDHSQRFGLPEGVRFHPRKGPSARLFGPPHVNYPGHDGRLRWNDTLQGDWITRIKGNLDVLFRDDPNVFVAGDLLWYPVEGNNRTRLAPDAMVAFGRPNGDRESYVQHQEGGIPPQVVFEVLPYGNRHRVMEFKRKFYERYGVEEYYALDPHKIGLEIWLRKGDAFRLISEASDWRSPRLGIRFELAEDMMIFAPDGRPFLGYVELCRQADEAQRQRVDWRQRADRLAAKLRALGIDPDE